MIVIPLSASAVPCNCVIFRLDDVQDYYLNSVQIEILQKFIDKNSNVTIGVIGNFTGNDQFVVSKVQQGHFTGLFELAIHGWNHNDYSNSTLYPLQKQKDDIQLTSDKMESLWGRNSTIFLMPFNSYNNDTLNAMQSKNLKIIGSKFDQELDLNDVYIANPPSNTTDSFGIYHLPQAIEYYSTASNTKTPLNTIMTIVNSTIATYGYAVVTLHPQDFSEKSSPTIATGVVNATEITDLGILIDTIRGQGKTIKTFSTVTSVSLPALQDNTPPVITPPLDVTQVNPGTPIISIGNATATDNLTPPLQIIIKNNSTDKITNGFPQGVSIVKWNATDLLGNSASAIQYVTVRTTPDVDNPSVTITAPSNSTLISGPADGLNIRVNGTASDLTSGVKIVTLNTNLAADVPVTPILTGNWTKWSYVLRVTDENTNAIDTRVYDFWNNTNTSGVTHFTINLAGLDTTPPELIPPANINLIATGPLTAVNLGTPKVFDNSDVNPIVSNNFGPGENPGFPPGTTIVTWTATDHASPPNSSTANQTVIFTYTAPQITSLTPATNSTINGGFFVNYILSEAVSLGTITFTPTGGATDNTVHTYNLVSEEITSGPHSISKATLETGFGNSLVDGAVYTMTVSVNDSVTGIPALIVNTLITYDATPPTFTIQYYSDSNLTTLLGGNPKLNVGTYYLKITSNEALSGAPTISIAAQGTANDANNAATLFVSGNDYQFTRTIEIDAAATGTTLENISITGTDLVNNTSTGASPTNEAAKAAFTDALPLCSTVLDPWVISSGCKITSTVIAPGNVEVQNGAVVKIKSTGSLNINFATKFLKIQQGSGILIESGGKIN
jgi:peptidoglycan/xylan/chitin deacetylase (PgdA/CDA1 family)